MSRHPRLADVALGLNTGGLRLVVTNDRPRSPRAA